MAYEILAYAKNISELLQNQKYEIDYYQREYRWGSKHIQTLIEDLSDKFKESYDSEHARKAVASYAPYFMGSIITCDKKDEKGAIHSYIVDGQQRLTSLTLLLIFLCRTLHSEEDKEQLKPLIRSRKHGHSSYNLDIPVRERCIDAIFNRKEEDLDLEDETESIINLKKRYEDIEEFFPEEYSTERRASFFCRLAYGKGFSEQDNRRFG